ncbi:PQQ-binding-like beta-propeller repeat protein [uncultured Maribacter sp.]|uniref:PQQ-binding-like beta-propeller repeat protein n=1 Tax=uncultured Maribacter sp. TaxID=431308 RepID=UPI002631C171|nr:PQQ-binding-like beta-propeller repeat protein [uncultured Maribacter sp.]
MKTLFQSYLTVAILLLVFSSCKNDDNASNYEIPEENIVVSGQATLTNQNKKLTIDLSDGNLIEETVLTSDNNIQIDKGYTYDFSATAIKKINSVGNIEWVKEYPEEVGKSNKLEDSNIVFSEQVLYVSYQILNTATYSSAYYLEALEIETGNTNWKINVSAETLPYLYKNRLITIQYPNGNASIVFQYRNKVHGHVEVEKTTNERINNYLFDGDLIIANSWSNKVFALDRSLNTVWSFNTDGANPRTGYIHEDQYLFYSRDQHVYSLHKDTGELKWKTLLPERFFLGMHQNENYTYIGHQLGTKTLSLSKINSENGEIESTMETAMSEDYYTTKLIFDKEYLLLVTSPTSDERDTEIEVKLLHLSKSKEIWSKYFNMNILLFRATLNSEE